MARFRLFSRRAGREFAVGERERGNVDVLEGECVDEPEHSILRSDGPRQRERVVGRSRDERGLTRFDLDRIHAVRVAPKRPEEDAATVG